MFMCHIGHDKLDMPNWAHNFSYAAVSTIFGALIYVFKNFWCIAFGRNSFVWYFIYISLPFCSCNCHFLPLPLSTWVGWVMHRYVITAILPQIFEQHHKYLEHDRMFMFEWGFIAWCVIQKVFKGKWTQNTLENML